VDEDRPREQQDLAERTGSGIGGFLKAGGGCRCLILALDVVLSPT
jgi:hypothetical protein